MRTEYGATNQRAKACLTMVGMLLLVGGATAWAADPPAEKTAKPAAAAAEESTEGQGNFWMQKKLEHTQHILSGLATEDFDQIGRSAQAMQRLGKIEAFVRRNDTEAYRTQFRVFQFANEELIRLAADKNIDGAALAFTQLTLSCVNCHKQLRSAAK